MLQRARQGLPGRFGADSAERPNRTGGGERLAGFGHASQRLQRTLACASQGALCHFTDDMVRVT